MDKKLILAVAGSGKTAYLINKLCLKQNSLIVTYTNNNFDNIKNRIIKKNSNLFNNNVVMTYYDFLYNFCYKPFLADIVNARGIDYNFYKNNFSKQSDINYYLNINNQFYSNRLALYLQNKCIDDIKTRISKHFNSLMIDEIQDFSGRDFDFLMEISKADVNVFLVGDFYQHTYSTSYDGNKNKNLFDDYEKYIKKFSEYNILCDKKALSKSYRCSKEICDYVTENLNISIKSMHDKNKESKIEYIEDDNTIKKIFYDNEIIKLHYQNSSKYGMNHKNWGDVKGMDDFVDVCVILNKETLNKKDNFSLLNPITKNKLYVAITRARRKVYFIEEDRIKKYINK